MNKLSLIFQNKINNEVFEGNVEFEDTVESICKELYLQPEFNNLNETIQLETSDGRILQGYEKFQNLNLYEGSTVFVKEAPAQSYINDNKTEKPPSPIGVKVPQQFHQLGIFVLDGSASMNEYTNGNVMKKDAVNMAIRDVLARFKDSSKCENFSFSVIAFDFSSSVKTSQTPAKKINENDNYDPTINHGTGTYIHTGLEEANRIAQKFLLNPTTDVYHSAVIMLLSDGECHEPLKTLDIASKIKQDSKVSICTTFLSRAGENNDAAEDLMKKISSNPEVCFKRTYDAETLRNFFESSISRASGS